MTAWLDMICKIVNVLTPTYLFRKLMRWKGWGVNQVTLTNEMFLDLPFIYGITNIKFNMCSYLNILISNCRLTIYKY